MQATRVSAWVRCFLQLSRRWLTQLTKEARTALRTLLPVRSLVGGECTRVALEAPRVSKKRKGQTFGHAFQGTHKH